MKRLLILMFAAFPLLSRGADYVIAQIIVTNQPTVGEALTINGSDTRTWAVTGSSTDVAIGTNLLYSATNLWLNLAGSSPSGGISVYLTSSNEVQLWSLPGTGLTATSLTNWATILFTTNSITTAQAVRVPMSVDPEAQRTNIASQLIRDIEAYSPTPFSTNSPLFSNFVDTSNAQSIGPKTIDGGIVTNLSGIHGTIRTLTGGLISSTVVTSSVYYGEIGLLINGLIDGATVTNGLFFGEIGLLSSGTIDSATHTNGLFYGQPGLLDGQGTGVLTNNEYHGTLGALVGSLGASFGPEITLAHISNSLVDGGTIQNVSASAIDAEDAWFDIIRFRRNNHSTLVDGDNSGMVATNAFTKIVAGPANPFTIHGVASDAGVTADSSAGTILILWNATGQNMTVANQSGSEATATYRIITNTGADVVTTGDGVVALIYDDQTQRWRVIWSLP